MIFMVHSFYLINFCCWLYVWNTPRSGGWHYNMTHRHHSLLSVPWLCVCVYVFVSVYVVFVFCVCFLLISLFVCWRHDMTIYCIATIPCSLCPWLCVCVLVCVCVCVRICVFVFLCLWEAWHDSMAHRHHSSPSVVPLTPLIPPLSASQGVPSQSWKVRNWIFRFHSQIFYFFGPYSPFWSAGSTMFHNSWTDGLLEIRKVSTELSLPKLPSDDRKL